MYLRSLLFLLLFTLSASGQNTADTKSYFQRASSVYNVPEDILLAVAGSQTHFTHVLPAVHDGDTQKQPPVYGIMALRDDAWFGHSLIQAARLIQQPADVLKNNIYYNIMGAAAYLAQLAKQAGINKSTLTAWKPVLEKYSGIPQDTLREFYSFEVFDCYRKGLSVNALELRPHPSFTMKIFRADVRGESSQKMIESTDYPSAVWDPSPNFTLNSITQLFAVVHTTEGSFSGALSWLKNPDAQASAHYIIRSSDGYMVQLVSESNKAWHARCWNGYMIGVEHEAYVAVASYYTDAMYLSSAALFRHFAQKFNFPMTRNRIVGHGEWQNTSWKTWMAANYPGIDVTCNTHTDPGVNWDWDFYMQLVTQDSTRPAIVTRVPAANDTVARTTAIKLTFNQKMKKTETQSAFSISPSVTGTFSWTDNQRTLVFTPASSLQPGTMYQVSIGTAAKNYLSLSPAAPLQHSFYVLPQLSITSVYPGNNSADLHLLPQITITFNTLVKPGSIAANVAFQSADNATIATTTASYSVSNGSGIISFTPVQPLNENSSYKITIKSTLLDTVGLTLGSASTYTFSTGQNLFLQGTVFDSLETIGGWKDPNYSGSTVGTDSNSTFTISTEKAKNGLRSGKLRYIFTVASGGVCREYNSSKPNQGSLSQTRTGLWIYGDLSNNFLEFWYYYNSSSNIVLRVDTLDWLGWKFVEVPLARITQAGDKLFHSLVIIQNPSGKRDGTIYIDDAQRTENSRIQTFCLAEGMYNPKLNAWNRDTLIYSLRQSSSPYTIIEQIRAIPDTTGSCPLLFTKAVMGTSYYFTVSHKNSIEAWSKTSRIISTPVQSFDFLSMKTNVFGDNLKQVGSRFCLFSGDVNQDGFVNIADLSLIDTDAYNFRTGVLNTDLNGDGIVDFTDKLLCDNNAFSLIQVLKPAVLSSNQVQSELSKNQDK